MTNAADRRWLALFALVPATLAIGLDVTVLTVALPTLATSLHATTGELQWFVVAYSLVFAAAMVPGGMLGDRIGRKRTLLVALAVFGLGSLSCAYASSSGQLIAARALLGLGAAVVTPMILSVLPVLFTEAERPKAIATIMAATMLGYPIGPILGGWLLDNAWWGWVFLMNVPVTLIAMLSVAWLVPESRASQPRGFDPVGIVASSAGLSALTYGVIEAGDRGWTDGTAFTWIVAGVVMLAGFVGWEQRSAEPLVDLGLFRSPGFTWGTALAVGVSFAMFGLMFGLPLYFQAVLGLDAQGSGLRLLPLVVGLLGGAPVADRLAKRIGDGPAIGLGLAVMAAVGTAVVQALRMVAGSFGAAVLGSVLNAGYHARLHLDGLPEAAAAAVRDGVVAGVTVADRLGSATLRDGVVQAFLHGMSLTLWVSAALTAACAALAVLVMPRHRTVVAGARDPRSVTIDG